MFLFLACLNAAASGPYDKTRWKRQLDDIVEIDVSKDTLDGHRLAV